MTRRPSVGDSTWGIARLALRYGLVLTGALVVVGGPIGFLAAGVPGLVAVLAGAGLTAIFMSFTAGSVLVAARVTHDDATKPVFYAIVVGVWAIKLLVFLVLTLVLRELDVVDPLAFGLSIIVAVLGSLTVDVLAFARARVPYVAVDRPEGRP
jgi:hypothetical protein